MNKVYDIVIFDLDGTLIDTSEGIFNSVRYAQKKLGLHKISDNELKLFIGPPPEEMYKKIYGLSDDDAKTATKFHREYGLEFGIYEARPYEDMKKCLKSLNEAGYMLGVATLKNEKAAKEILHHFEMDKYFDVILGMSSSEKSTKAELILTAVEQLGGRSALMVGDSLYDLDGAKKAKVDFAAALYGFGYKEKPEDAVVALNNALELMFFLVKSRSKVDGK